MELNSDSRYYLKELTAPDELVPAEVSVLGASGPRPDAAKPDGQRLKAKADEIRRLYHEGLTGLIRAAVICFNVKQEIVGGAVGRDKAELYREWHRFVEEDVGWSRAQGNRMGNLGRVFGSHLDLVPKFDLTAMQDLSTRGTTQALEQALSLAQSGEYISHARSQELMGCGKGKKPKGKGSRSAKDYSIAIPNGKVVVAAPHKRLTDVRSALMCAVEVVEARIAKRSRVGAV